MAEDVISKTSYNALYGRKIFFINPNHLIEQRIGDYLHDNEYENYVIWNYKDAKNFLRKYPGSIVYIYIDSTLSKNGWFNFIDSFKEDEILQTLSVGIIADSASEAVKKRFLTGLNIEAGIISLDAPIDTTQAGILDFLEAKNAKGQRQYVRAKIKDDTDTYMLWNINNKMFKLSMMDLSSVGMAVKVTDNVAPFLTQNGLMSNVDIKIGLKAIPVTAFIYALKSINDQPIAVLLIKNISPKDRNSIRQYVASVLQVTMINSLGAEPQDDTDYEAKKEES